jgi:hypothetical protein
MTKNFTLAELTKTSVKADNTPTAQHIAALQALCDNVLQPARDALGPLKINSGYRSAKVNDAVGGAYKIENGKKVPTSQHSKGEAADLNYSGGNDILFHWLVQNVEFDQIIWEFGTDKAPAWVHVSYSTIKNRGQKLKAVKVGGKTKYLPL